MKIAVLCNNRLALPVIKKQLDEQKIGAIGVSDKAQEIVQFFRQVNQQYNLPFQVFSKKGFGSQLEEWLNEHKPDAVFVVTFPYRIPARLLKVPKYGFINIHPGLLPEMRGADPIFETVRQQKSIAGVTAHIMDEGFDTGPIVLRKEIPCMPQFTYGMLSSQLVQIAAEMSNTLTEKIIWKNELTTTEQDNSKAVYDPAIPQENLVIRWQTMNSAEIIALVNACNPVAKSGVLTTVNGWTIGICDVSPITITGDLTGYSPGSVLVNDPQNGLLVLANDGIAIKLEVVYTEEGFFPGYKLANWHILPGVKFSDPQ